MGKGRAASPYVEVLLEHVNLRRAGRRVLEDISWRVRPGERWVLLGPNGAGKTQFLKLVGGIVWPTPTPSPHERTVRRYLWQGELSDTAQLVKEEIVYLGAERQDKYQRYGWDTSAERIVGTGIYRTDIPLDVLTHSDRRRIRIMLKRLGIVHLAGRAFLSLSYGERRVILLARALISRPKLLLLDEVLNGLDETNRRRIGRWLERQKGRLPWVFATHHMDEVPPSATHALLLEEGKIVYAGRVRGAPIARAIVSPAKRRAVASRRLPGTGNRRRTEAGRGRVLVRLTNASVYLDDALVLAKISLTVREGEFWLVHGPNGSGKTTLLRTLYGDHGIATGGRVERAGIAPGVPLERFRKRVGLVAPHLQTDYPRDLRVTEVVQSGRHASIGLNDRPSATDQRAARRALSRFDLAGFGTRTLRELSYGQSRRVLFARAFVNEPRLLLLDEPFAAIDATTRRALLRQVLEAHRRGTAVVVSAHTMRDWRAVASHAIELAGGRVRGGGATIRRRGPPRPGGPVSSERLRRSQGLPRAKGRASLRTRLPAPGGRAESLVIRHSPDARDIRAVRGPRRLPRRSSDRRHAPDR
jgi:molybdate transport system ATP-binding protein